MSTAERTAVDAFENKRFKNKIEYGTLIAINGRVLIEKKGSSGSVSMPSGYYKLASVMSHNHPRGKGEEGLIGGTFSEADISTLNYDRLYTIRATAAEGTYSMTKGVSFDSAGLQAYYRKVDNSLNKAFTQSVMDAVNAYTKLRTEHANGGNVSAKAVQDAYQHYKDTETREFNRYLVGLHNALLAGQKKYGYTYTLERR